MNWTDRIVDMLQDPVCAVDRDGHLVFVNRAYVELMGYGRDELLGRRMLDLVHPDDRERTRAAAASIMDGVPVRHFRNRYIRRDGVVLHLMWSARWSPEDGMRIAVARDMTQMVREEALNAIAFDMTRAVIEADGVEPAWAWIEAAFGRWLGDETPVAMLESQLDGAHLGEGWNARDADLDRAAHHCATLRPEAGASPVVEGAWTLVPFRADPAAGWLGLHRPPRPSIEIDAAACEFLASQVAGVLRMKLLERQLRQAALHDPLTGLPNRRLFADRAHLALDRAERSGSTFGLLYVDVDDFKGINDRFGHAAGDAVLARVAQALSSLVRRTDTVARMGGDEFVVLIDGPVPREHVDALGAEVAATFRPGAGDGREGLPGVSVGVAMYPDDGLSLDRLLAAADRRMYRSKAG